MQGKLKNDLFLSSWQSSDCLNNYKSDEIIVNPII